MEDRYKLSWKLIFMASRRLRDYGLSASEIDEQDFHQVTIAQERVLEVIFASETGVKLKDVAEKLELTPGAVSQTTETLVRDGLVERYTSPGDRRAIVLQPTEKCRKLRALSFQHFSRVMENALRRISTKERETFVNILEQVIEQTADRCKSMRRKKGTQAVLEEKE